MIIALIGFVVLAVPQSKLFGSRSLTVKADTAELNSYNQRISDLDTLKSNASFQNVINELYQAMPSDSEVPAALVTIGDLGANSGITFTGVNVGSTGAAVSSGSTVPTVPVTVSFSGSLSNVESFLNALYNNIRTVQVQSQTINSDNSGNLIVTMELGLVYQGGGNQ
jgi:Tfp pilus assembly protein PilO